MNCDRGQGSQGNILVVDDNPQNTELLVWLLQNEGYRVMQINVSRLAVAAAQSFGADLVLLDIMMPQMNGYEVCERLKANPNTGEIPIIFLSGLGQVPDKVKALNLGGVDYITKPFQLEEVLARVKTHLTIRFLQCNLQLKNEELTAALEQLKKTQSQLVHSEKLAALGQLVAGLAHELNTPLGAIRSSIEIINQFVTTSLKTLPEFLQRLTPAEQEYFMDLLRQTNLENASASSREKREKKRLLSQELSRFTLENSEAIADGLIELGIFPEIPDFIPRLGSEKTLKILDLAEDVFALTKSARNITIAAELASKVMFALKAYNCTDSGDRIVKSDTISGIETVLILYEHQFKHGVQVIKQYGDIPEIFCYPAELTQVWVNVIQNALYAMNYQGTLTIQAFCQGDRALYKFTDTGVGIPPELQSQVFEPFFTTKPPGEGSGLGLDIVRKIVKKHQGSITVASFPGQTTFTIELPLSLPQIA